MSGGQEFSRLHPRVHLPDSAGHPAPRRTPGLGRFRVTGGPSTEPSRVPQGGTKPEDRTRSVRRPAPRDGLSSPQTTSPVHGEYTFTPALDANFATRPCPTLRRVRISCTLAA